MQPVHRKPFCRFDSPFADSVARGPTDIKEALTATWRAFAYEDLRRATNGFALENLVGEGAYGRVFHGVLADETHVAIKQLKAGPKVRKGVKLRPENLSCCCL